MIWVNLGLLRARTAEGSRSIDTVGNSTGLQVKEAAIADWLSVVPIDQHHSLLLSPLKRRTEQDAFAVEMTVLERRDCEGGYPLGESAHGTLIL